MSIAIDPMIRTKLEQFVDRRRRWTYVHSLLIAIVVWLIGVLLFTWVDAVWILDRTTRSMLTLMTYTLTLTAGLSVALRRLREADPIARAAIAIERERPELRDQLLSAVELARVSEATGSQSFIDALQQSVAGKIRAVDVRSLLPLRLLSKPMLAAVLAVLGCLMLALLPQLHFGNRFARAVIPGFDIDRVSRTRILIEQPAPPSRSVPAEEITAIVVHIEGELADEATLQWRSEDGSSGIIEMHPTEPPEIGNAETIEKSFATNLMIRQSLVSYRVMAGDGVTRWQTLKPRSRPEVISFETEMTPPAFTKLPTTTATSSDGNLNGIAGTQVTLRLSFNMPVKEVIMRRMNSDRRFPIRADGDRWTIDTMIDVDDRYQVLAKSVETDFDNPLSPQHAITPIDDLPPIAKWKEQSQAVPSSKVQRELVTAFSKLNMSAVFVDEMPMDRIVQEVSINNGDWRRTPLEGSLETSNVTRDWAWDLQPVRHKDQELKAGDVIQTRVIAIDRKGSRGESSIKEFIVSDHEFDASKLERLKSWMTLADDLGQWKRSIDTELLRLKVIDPNDQLKAGDKDTNFAANRDARNALLIAMMDKAEHESEAAKLEALARGMRRVEDSLQQASAIEEGKRREYQWIKNNAEIVSESVKTEVAHHLGMVLIDNVMRMSASLQPTVRQSDPIDWKTFNRFFEITREQYKELTQLVESTTASIPDSTSQQNINLLRWIDEQQRRLSEAIAERDNEHKVRETAKQTVNDLGHCRRHMVVDGQIANRQIEWLKRMQIAIGWTRDSIQKMVAASDEITNWNQKTNSTNSDEVRQANERIASTKDQLELLGKLLISRLAQDGSLHRHRPEADQRYVADTHLLERVLEQVGEESFKPAAGKKMRDVYQEISAAYHWLETGHDTTQWGRELRALADDDRWNANTASGRVDGPNRAERFTNGLEFSINGLQQAGMDWKELEPIGNMRWNQGPANVYSEITSRRWKTEEAVSVADNLEERCAKFETATAPIEPHLEAARKILQAYLPSIVELAKKTAATLRESKVNQDKSAADAQQKREQAERQAEQLKESLADEANTQELMKADGRRKARNADIAMRAIEKRMEDVQSAAEQAKTAAPDKAEAAKTELNERTEKAAKTLERIAQHYEQENAGQSAESEKVANDDASLKALEEELGLTKPLDQQFAKSDAIAKALNSDPLELLKKLQQELKRNELMQKELDSITDRTLQEAQKSLREQAARERELQMQLERSDPQLAVAKRELEESIRRTAELGQEVERSLLTAANQAAESLRNLPQESSKRADETKKEMQAATQKLREAINEAHQVGSADNQLMQDLQSRSKSVEERIAGASEMLNKNDKPLEEIRNDAEAKLDDKRRDEEKRQMENVQRRARDNQVQMARDQQRRAEQRQNQAEQESRNAKSRIQREEENLRRTEERKQQEPKNEGLANEAKRIVNELHKAEDAFKASELAFEMTKQANEVAKQHVEQAGNTQFPQLDQPRPAAQLAQSMQHQASTQLDQAREKLKSAAEKANQSQSIQPASEVVSSANDAQKRVADVVTETAEDLARAARHQQRLGQTQAAQQSFESSTAVERIAEGEVKEASKSLSAVKESQAAHAGQPTQAEAARKALSQSQSALSDQAEKLAQASQHSSDAEQNADSKSASESSSEATPQQAAAESARQMARTLDELDRSLSESRKASKPSSSSGEPSEGSKSSQSPATLAAAARRQAQKLAMRRSQKAQPNSPPPKESAEQSQATESGDGNSTAMADMFDLDTVERASDQKWGKLQSREAEDVSEERRVEISPEYRRQIEAYFRVIAEKGKQ